MPIIKRVLPAYVGFTHKIHTQQFTGGISVKAERIVEASPQLHWAVGQRYDKVRETCSSRGWTLEKIVPKK